MQVNQKQFVNLWALCVLGCLAVLPYVYFMGIISFEISVWKMIMLAAGQGALLFGLMCRISYKVMPKTDLCPFPILQKKAWLSKIGYPASIAGAFIGFAIVVFDKTIFHSSPLAQVTVPMFTAILASIYGAINEEVALRLFVFTLLYFFAKKCIKTQRIFILWSVNVCVALLFGIGHLPAAFRLTAPSMFEIFRILSLNGVGGVVFGWLYWSRGLVAAMIAHFVGDLVVHVLL